MLNILNRIKRLTTDGTDKSDPQLKVWSKVLSLALLFIIIQAGTAQAITVTVAPNPAAVNQSVTATSTVSVYSTGGCTIEVNFGDGPSYITAGICTTLAPSTCSYGSTHTYTIPGTYKITSRSRAGACSGIANNPNPATTSINVLCAPLNITTASPLSSGTVNQAYSANIAAAGGQTPYTYSLISGSLPPGLTLGATGIISGTPATAGTYSFTVKTADSCSAGAQNSTKAFTLTVNPAACSALNITSPSSLSTGTVGTAYSYQLNASGGQTPYTYSLVSGSMGGLNLSSTGLITGVPPAAGTYTFTVKVADSCGSGVQNKQQTFTLTVNSAACPALSITTASPLSSGTVNQAYSANIAAAGGQTPYTYSLISGSLPPGLTLGATGSISGTPATAGTYTFTVNLVDSCGAGVQNIQKTFSITINQTAQNVTLNITPANFRVALGTAGFQNILYIFTATGAADISLQSNKGVFMAGGSVIGEVNTSLQANIRGGNATVNETLTIPVAISKRAEALRTNRITYSRSFSNETMSLTARAEGILTTEAGADFSIKRIQLYFANRRPETTVKMGQPLKAQADLSFTGSGLLQGYWEVDGRLLSAVNTHIVYGATVTLDTPELPALPTFDPGSHIVRFVVTKPALNITTPEAVYFVTNEEYAGPESRIELVSPEDNASIDYASLKFTWTDNGRNEKYLIEIFDAGDRQKVFSAYVKGPEYLLHQPMLLKIFAPGGNYLWKVKGFDKDNAASGESKLYRFSFKEQALHLPGQIIVALDNSLSEGRPMEELIDKYRLVVIEAFDIKAINFKVVVFSTKEDIFGLIKKISKETGVVITQPNYIFRTMSEPMSGMQNIYKTFNLAKLHQHYKGRNVLIAIVDTGVDTGHRDLKERIIHSENLIKGSPNAAEIHGTAVAGVIAAGSNDFGIEGLAPEAGILALRACIQVSEANPEGECYTSSIAKALDLAIERKAGIVNMSFGSPAPDSLITRLIDEGSGKGVFFVAPVGNNAKQKALDFPASHPAVLSVAGTDDQGKPYPNKELAAKARVSAPYKNLYSTIPGDRHNFISGTSMSSASVAGLLALAIEKNGGVDIHKLPVFNGDICKWNEELLKLALCGE